MNEADRHRMIIELKNISHRYRDAARLTLDNVDLQINARERVALIGASGAGKSSLLALIDNRLTNWHGQAFVLQHPVAVGKKRSQQQRADVGFIFQEFALIDRASVLQNVLNGRLGRTSKWASLLGKFSDHDYAAAHQALQDVGLEDVATRRTDQLSGGQRQRVAIARCLAQEPKLILADEPISNLDPERAASVLQLLSDLALKRELTVIFSSHQPDLAVQYSDRLIGMSNGRIVLDQPSSTVFSNQLAKFYGGSSTTPDLRSVC